MKNSQNQTRAYVVERRQKIMRMMCKPSRIFAAVNDSLFSLKNS
nr:MAG TPA: hypothetical protein [Caudoviricetes sp.]